MTESDNGAAPRQLKLFAVESVATAPLSPPSYDSYWDEITNGDCDRWNPAEFGEVPRIVDDGGQVSVFYDDSDEPPDPDDYLNQAEYEQVWHEWESVRVLEHDTRSSVPEQKTPVSQGSTDVPEHIKAVPEHLHWVERYCPSNRKDNHYYRYCWKTGRKIKHRHITGGNVRSQLAQHRKAEVEIAIAAGLAPVEIEKLIRSWRTPNSCAKVTNGETH